MTTQPTQSLMMIEVLSDQKTPPTYRIGFKSDQSGNFFVVKLFSHGVKTVKWWTGADWESVKSYWNTNVVIPNRDCRSEIRTAVETISEAVKAFTTIESAPVVIPKPQPNGPLQIVDLLQLQQPQFLIMGPMTCGKTTLVNEAAIPTGLLIDGDFPFSHNPDFNELWRQLVGRGAADGLWEEKDIDVLNLSPWGLVTHQSRRVFDLALDMGYTPIILLPFESAEALHASWKEWRADWVNSVEADVKAWAHEAYDLSLALADSTSCLIVRTMDHVSLLADVLHIIGSRPGQLPIDDDLLKLISDNLLEQTIKRLGK